MRRQAITIVGVLLIAMGIGIAIGVGAVAYQGISSETNKELAAISSLEFSQDTQNPTLLEATLGGLALMGGTALVLTADRESRSKQARLEHKACCIKHR